MNAVHLLVGAWNYPLDDRIPTKAIIQKNVGDFSAVSRPTAQQSDATRPHLISATMGETRVVAQRLKRVNALCLRNSRRRNYPTPTNGVDDEYIRVVLVVDVDSRQRHLDSDVG